MNKENMFLEEQGERRLFFKISSKMRDAIVIGLLAFVLIFAVSQVFNNDKSNKEIDVFNQTDSEKKIAQILSQIDGVGDVEVMIGALEDHVSGVVVVCEGANNLRVVMDIREAVCAALGTQAKDVKIYLKD